MENNKPFESIEKESFSNQPITDQNLNNDFNTNKTQFQEYSSKRLIDDKPKKSKLHIASLIITVFIVFLIISTFFLSWYCLSINMSMFFIFPVSVNADMNFNLEEMSFDASSNMNTTHMSKSVSYNEIEEKAIKQEKTNAQNLADLFRNITILIIALLVFSIIAFIGILCIILDLGNKNTMKKIGLAFAILTFIFGIITASYFMYKWDPNIINKALPDSDEDDSSISYTNILDTEKGKNELKNIGFWDSGSIGLSLSDMNNSNMSFFGTGSNYNLFTFGFSSAPGLPWYFMILISILSLFSIVLLLNKNLKIMLILLFVCSIIVFGVLYYLSLNANAQESSSDSSLSWGDNSDPAEVARFVGNWKLDVNNTFGHNKWGYNISDETWVFWENDTFNNYRISTEYEGGGSGHMSCMWSAKDKALSICDGTYNYVFSDNYTKVNLTKDDEIIVLNKIIG